MVASIGSGGSSSHLRFLDKANKEKEKSFAKLASGKMDALENPAGAAVVADLEAELKKIDQASRNIGDAASLIAVGEGALSEINNNLDRISELTMQANNGTYSAEQRSAMQAEATQLAEEVNRTIQTTEFNGQKIFSGSSPISIQVGTGSDANSQISIPSSDLAAQAQSLSSIDLMSAEGRNAAVATVDTFKQQLTSQRGEFGASQSRLDVADASARKSSETTAGAAARIRDIDYAEETANMTRNNILAQGATAMAAHANLSQQMVTRLLG